MRKKKFVLPSHVPEPSYVTYGKCTRVIDGDTIEVEVKRTFHIRLIGVNKAELNTNEGVEAKASLENEVLNQEVLVQIPFGKNEQLVDFNSFSRICAHVWHQGKLLC